MKSPFRRDTTLEPRVRELELQSLYPDQETLANAIQEAVVSVARYEATFPAMADSGTRRDHEEVLIELARYAGRSGLLK